MGHAGEKTPEQAAREAIDASLVEAGWLVQSWKDMNVYAGPGVAVREFRLGKSYGFADYMLFVDGKAVGVLEAKAAGHTLSGVEPQAERYAKGLPETLDPPLRPLPFLYLSTGAITRFTNLLDPKPKSREIFQIHRPTTLAEWLAADTLDAWVKSFQAEGGYTTADDEKPSTFRSRLSTLRPIEPDDTWTKTLYPNQVQGVNNLETSLKQNRPRALVQMATGSGKTIFAITSAYRLIKYGGARRVLFLVDRSNLGLQAKEAFEGFRTPDDHRKFAELYTVQHLSTNTIGASAKVVITTIQRLYSMLQGEPELAAELEDGAIFGVDALDKDPVPVAYNAAYPPEYFDAIIIDECHRSIYSLWRQVLDYFDAFLIGLTATPAKHTFGFFNQNLVMEYSHEQAVADGVNVDFEVYPIRTRITEQGATVLAEEGPQLGYRSRETRKVRWEKADEDLTYAGKDLDRAVVSKPQIRLVVRTFRDRLFTEIFPGRKEVPKTLVFAKDDSHAEDVVEMIREEFGEGNTFCQKITYKVTSKKPADLINDFRTSYHPRIAVTVDMIATGTDIRPIEIVMFMRSVKSRVLWEQMKGRGVRIIDPTELVAVTPSAQVKDHFVIVDCVGMTESALNDTQPLDTQKTVPFEALLTHLKAGGRNPAVLTSLASRLARMAKRCTPQEHAEIAKVSGGQSLGGLSEGLLQAVDPDRQMERARQDNGLPPDTEPTAKQIAQAAEALVKEVAVVLADAEFSKLLLRIRKPADQVVDEISQDELLFAGVSKEAQEKARALTTSFEQYLADHKDEISALQFFYAVPHSRRPGFQDIKALAQSIQAPPRAWTPEKLWRAYETLDRDRVRGGSATRLLTDVVSLVRFALHTDEALVPFAEQVAHRYQTWLAQQANTGRVFTPEQLQWLEMIRDHVAAALAIDLDAFDYAPFAEAGGLGRARKVFGKALDGVLEELNEVLAA